MPGFAGWTARALTVAGVFALLAAAGCGGTVVVAQTVGCVGGLAWTPIVPFVLGWIGIVDALVAALFSRIARAMTRGSR